MVERALHGSFFSNSASRPGSSRKHRSRQRVIITFWRQCRQARDLPQLGVELLCCRRGRVVSGWTQSRPETDAVAKMIPFDSPFPVGEFSTGTSG